MGKPGGDRRFSSENRAAGEGEKTMPKVQGVMGPIECEDLGFTLMHEHILIANWSMRQAYADWVDLDEVIAFYNAEKLKETTIAS